ncbi:uncharacterized protein LOC113334558 [Papaver somniferum]|uniref:uncharacterized protein LOC113334558 n=1 Tax=Papaver somniferum TaxID=3469 RepID=UPI000E700845|nr:uncharacterized protein LOC113334558 [Papaver somniferum]
MSEQLSLQRVNQFCFQNSCIVSSIERSGGPWLLWKDDVTIEVISKSKNLIHVTVQNDGLRIPWHLLCIYGPPVQTQRASFWRNMTLYVQNFDGCKCFICDFNAISSGTKKIWRVTGLEFKNSNISFFNEFIQQNHLIDLGYNGPASTWTNGMDIDGLIQQRLDEVLANPKWCIGFHMAAVLHLPRIASDHSLILLNTCRNVSRAPPN